MKTHHEKLTPLDCQICFVRFVNECDLNTHILEVHKDLPEFQCHICPSTFRLRANLRKHVLATHET